MQKALKGKRKKKNLDLLDIIIDGIDDLKGEDIVSLDLTEIDEAVADYFVLCSVDVKVQVKAIADHVVQKVKEKTKETPWHIEGYENSEWVILDYFDIVVHIFIKDLREFYQLEDLWHDAKLKEYSSK